MIKELLLLAISLFLISSLSVVEGQAQTDSMSGSVYKDSTGQEYIECKMAVTPDGILIPVTGSPLEGYILLPTRAKYLTTSDLQDIFTLINYYDLKNRLKKE